MPDRPPLRRRARPVADAPVRALALRAEDLTKGWLLGVLEDAPLEDAPAILATDLARDGPRLCAAVVQALGSDDALQRLEPEGALEGLAASAGSFAGARDCESICRVVDALGGVIWAAVRGELAQPDADQVSDLAERLSLVLELVRRAALRGAAEQPGEVPRERSAAARPRDPLWMGALDDEVVRAERLGTPLSLLLVELEDADRVLAADGAREAAATFGRFAHAVRGVTRQQDILACESDARAWLIARDTTRSGARALGKRIVRAVQGTHSWRGAPLSVNLGVAVFGEDGRDGDRLIQAAEEAMFAAAAAGSDVGDELGEGAGEVATDPGPELVG